VKLASFNYDGADRIGVLKNDDEIAIIDSVGGMIDLIQLGGYAMEHIEHAIADGKTIGLSEIVWQPPIRKPGKICGVAMNNSASNERKISAPDHPAFFLKPSSCLIGHNEAIRVRPYYGSAHPEPELAVIIGRSTRDVDAKEALASVFGYSIFNDITGNGMRAEDMFHYWALYADEQNPDKLERREQHLSYAARYKGTDTFGCMGPCITTIDEISDPDELDVSCRVNGETIAEDSTRYYNYKVAELISYISQFLTLDAGDIISCGTAFKPSKNRKSIHQANFQRVAGPVEVTISGLGTLTNSVEIEDKAMGQWRLNQI
jgi:2-keto-4-pentenoate hydratase/2-oxohepta-3-ene-1,7-dioic acid hydratase in catechol pathway